MCDSLATYYPPRYQFTASSMSNFLTSPCINWRKGRFLTKLGFYCCWCHSHTINTMTHNLCHNIQSEPKSMVTVRSNYNGWLEECLPGWIPLCGSATGCVSNIDVSLYHAGVDVSAGPLYTCIGVSLPHRATMPSRLGFVMGRWKFWGKGQRWSYRFPRLKR